MPEYDIFFFLDYVISCSILTLSIQMYVLFIES